MFMKCKTMVKFAKIERGGGMCGRTVTENEVIVCENRGEYVHAVRHAGRGGACVAGFNHSRTCPRSCSRSNRK
jgi:hypothetical protein